MEALSQPEINSEPVPVDGARSLPQLAGILAIATIGLLAYPSVCIAEEGFDASRETLPVAVQPAWEATFSVAALPGRKGGIGSAVLIASKPMGSGKLALYLLTADHVVASKCGPRLGACENIVLSSSRNDAIEDSPKRTVTGAEVAGRLEPEDLSLLKIEVEDGEAWALRPVPVAEHCDPKPGQPVFLVGFPNALTRSAGDMKPIDDQAVLKRRWSKGIVLGPVSSQGDWVGTTADALQGSSGGPAFDADGGLIGVLHRVAGPRYAGNESEDKTRRSWQSLLVRCESIRTFLEDSLKSRSE